MVLMSYWKKYLEAINDLQLRERKLITITASVIVFSLFFVASWQSILSEMSQYDNKIYEIKNRMIKVQGQKEEVLLESKIDPNKIHMKQIDALRLELDKQQATIESITSALISPKNMNQVFSALLQNSELEVSEIRNSPAESINVVGENADSNLLYKHGLSLAMEGTFDSSVRYLQRVEDQYWYLYWDELIFETKTYPNGMLNLKVHTMSTSNSVLGL